MRKGRQGQALSSLLRLAHRNNEVTSVSKFLEYRVFGHKGSSCRKNYTDGVARLTDKVSSKTESDHRLAYQLRAGAIVPEISRNEQLWNGLSNKENWWREVL